MVVLLILVMQKKETLLLKALEAHHQLLPREKLTELTPQVRPLRKMAQLHHMLKTAIRVLL